MFAVVVVVVVGIGCAPTPRAGQDASVDVDVDAGVGDAGVDAGGAYAECTAYEVAWPQACLALAGERLQVALRLATGVAAAGTVVAAGEGSPPVGCFDDDAATAFGRDQGEPTTGARWLQLPVDGGTWTFAAVPDERAPWPAAGDPIQVAFRLARSPEGMLFGAVQLLDEHGTLFHLAEYAAPGVRELSFSVGEVTCLRESDCGDATWRTLVVDDGTTNVAIGPGGSADVGAYAVTNLQLARFAAPGVQTCQGAIFDVDRVVVARITP